MRMRRSTLVLAGLAVLTLLSAVLAIGVGSVAIPPSATVRYLTTGDAGDPTWTVLLEQVRLPRAITAILAGAGLAVAGLLMQTLFANPLADPYILGVSSGAGLGVALSLLGTGTGAGAFVAGLGAGGRFRTVVAAGLGGARRAGTGAGARPLGALGGRPADHRRDDRSGQRRRGLAAAGLLRSRPDPEVRVVGARLGRRHQLAGPDVPDAGGPGRCADGRVVVAFTERAAAGRDLRGLHGGRSAPHPHRRDHRHRRDRRRRDGLLRPDCVPGHRDPPSHPARTGQGRSPAAGAGRGADGRRGVPAVRRARATPRQRRGAAAQCGDGGHRGSGRGHRTAAQPHVGGGSGMTSTSGDSDPGGEDPGVSGPAGNGPAGNGPGARDLVLEGLSVGYQGGWRRPDTIILAGLELRGIAGRVTVLLGPNGSGKSTLLRS